MPLRQGRDISRPRSGVVPTEATPAVEGAQKQKIYQRIDEGEFGGGADLRTVTFGAWTHEWGL